MGKNGAGKSTIFKTIVGEQFQSSGNIFKNKDSKGVFLTYCPQTDNCDENMTPYSLLHYLCEIYGYNEVTKDIVIFYFNRSFMD